MWPPLSPVVSPGAAKYEHNPFGLLPSLRTLDLPTMDITESLTDHKPHKHPPKKHSNADVASATSSIVQPTVLDYFRQQREHQAALASQLWSQSFPAVSQQQRAFTDVASEAIPYIPNYYNDSSLQTSPEQHQHQHQQQQQYYMQSSPSYIDPLTSCDQSIQAYYSTNPQQESIRKTWSDMRTTPFSAYNLSNLSPSQNYSHLVVDSDVRARYTAPPTAAAQAAAAEIRAQQASQTVGRRRRRRCPPSYGNYATMIAHEILQSPRRKMTLRQIYHHLEARFPDMFSDDRPGEVGGKGWQNTVRHSLSINSCFIKIPRNKDDDTDSEEETDYCVSSDGRMTPHSTKRPSAGYKKGGYWAVDESHLATITHNGKLDLRRIAAAKPNQSHPYTMI